jgi:preprotein translocase subunit Sec61beta
LPKRVLDEMLVHTGELQQYVGQQLFIANAMVRFWEEDDDDGLKF